MNFSCVFACLQVFGLLNIIIERLGEDINPHVQGLLPLLPQIWHDAHDQSLLRIQVGWRGFMHAVLQALSAHPLDYHLLVGCCCCLPWFVS